MSTAEEDRLDELDALSRDDEDFFYKTALLTRQGKDGMVEIPLPFKENDPVFTCNRSTAPNRETTIVETRFFAPASTLRTIFWHMAQTAGREPVH